MPADQSSSVRLVVLDRDGVINEDREDFVRCPADWVPIEGSLRAIERLNRKGILVAIATNQSGSLSKRAKRSEFERRTRFLLAIGTPIFWQPKLQAFSRSSCVRGMGSRL